MSRTLRSILYGVTLGVLLALLIAPQSGWLVRFQTLSLLRFAPLPGYGLGDSVADQRRLKSVALSYPGDYQLQYASLPWSGSKKLEGLRGLETRFPDNASLRANVLRQACAEEIRTDRLEWHLLEQTPVPQNYDNGLPRVDPNQLAAFDQDAAEGERLDPDNAYFPFMRAVGLYAAHKDAYARAAILRAGTKTYWKEYYDDEFSGQTRLYSLAFGDRSAILRITIESSILFPHYASLRQISWLATYQAMKDEQAGNIKEGIALRHALIHCGGLMRAQSPLLIGSIVGIAIVRTAMQRPGGAPWAKEDESNNWSMSPSFPIIKSFYAAYLRRVGLEAEARYALAEGAADQQAGTILPSWDRIFMSIYGTSLRHLMWCWIAGLLLLAVIPWLLLLRVLSAMLALTPTVREARPLPGCVSWGSIGGTLAALGVLLFAAFSFNADLDDFSAGFIVILLLLMIILPILFLWRMQARQFQRHSIGYGLGIAALTCAGWCGIYGLAQWQSTEPLEFVNMMRILMGIFNSGGLPPGEDSGMLALHLFAPLAALAVPLLLVVTLAVISRVRRLPLSAGLVSGCRAVCLPLACVLLLAYGAVTLVTLHQERIVNDTLTQSLRGEGAYVAARTGQVWPGVVQ